METRSAARKKLKLSSSGDECKPQALSLLELPIINMYQVLSYLDPGTLLTKVQLICKYFRDIIKDDSFWKSLRQLSFETKESFPYMVAVIKKCKNLEHLEIGGTFGFYVPTSVPSCVFDVLCHSRLRSLKFYYIDMDLVCEKSLKQFMKTASALTCLHLMYCYHSICMGNIISEGKGLQELRIIGGLHNENQAFRKIFLNCISLKHLNISLSTKFNYSLFALISKSIQKLYLTVGSFPSNSFAYLKNFSEFSFLSISSMFLTYDVLFDIKELKHLSGFELLSTLLLTPIQLLNFFDTGSFSQLKYLFLDECAVENYVLEAIADKCPELEHLQLIDSDVTDKGIFYLIRKCTKLNYLELKSNRKLKGAFLTVICKHLKYLNIIIVHDSVNVKILRKFANLNPSFTIGEWKEDIKPMNRQLFIVNEYDN